MHVPKFNAQDFFMLFYIGICKTCDHGGVAIFLPQVHNLNNLLKSIR